MTKATIETDRIAELEALGQAWALNMERQRAAQADCRSGPNEAAYKEADARWDKLTEEEAELSYAIRQEPASTGEDLALKGRVVLREIGLTGGNTPSDTSCMPSIDELDDLDLGQRIAASLTLDLIRLARTSA